MKIKDPLDHKIDALLASRPLRPSDRFAARVLDAAEADNAPVAPVADVATRRQRPLGKLLAFALPLAAAVVLTLSLLQLDSGDGTPTAEALSLTTAEVQEIFLLEESLANLAAADASGFTGDELLATLDILYAEI